MNPNLSTNPSGLPLHLLLRRRRQELALFQAQVAEALHVTPECIGQWENGHRRMELSKIPRIAEVLKLDPRQLCAKALAEFYPLVYATRFGKDTSPVNIQRATA